MNSSNVFSSTNNNVKDLTNIAPIPNPIEIIIISLLNANAPKTPSKENDASISSRYKNEIKPVPINLPILEHSCCLFSDVRVIYGCYSSESEAYNQLNKLRDKSDDF